MAEIFVGLGSNLDGPADNLRQAVRRLGRRLTIVRLSSAYSTEPVGLRDQPFFLNAVLQARADFQPRDLLTYLAGVEDEMGRQRGVPLGPRKIDLDLLLYDDCIADEPGLSLPHPQMAERRFVLAPLAEIAPDVCHARLQRTAAELLAALPQAESVERISLPNWPPTLLERTDEPHTEGQG